MKMKMKMKMEMEMTGEGATATRSSIVVRLSGEKGRDDDVDDNKGSLGDSTGLSSFFPPPLPVPSSLRRIKGERRGPVLP